MNKKPFLLIILIALKFALQFIIISPGYDLQRDEYLHLDQANHLAWGYLSVPPFTSWLSYFIHLFGGNVFWVKFFPALFGSLTILVVWKTIEALQGNLFSLVLGCMSILFSALLRLNTLYQPNSFDVLCWAACYYILIKYFTTYNARWLYIGAIVFALGFLNKYNIAFLLIGLLPAILLTKQRKIFTKPDFYKAFLFGLLLILPNLWWQYQNNFPVVHHIRELSETQLVNVNRIDFIKSQLMFYLGAVFVILAGFYALLFYNPFRPYRLFFWAYLFTITAFIYFKAKDYYAIGLYPVYIAFGSVYLENVLSSGWKKFLRPVLIAMPVLFFLLLFKIALPNKSPQYILEHREEYKKFGLLRWEDGKDHSLPQDYADMLGWKELAAKVDSVFASMPNPSNTLILCDNYGQAGAINFYTKNKGLVASSFNADYVNWLRFDTPYKDAILVKENDDDDKDRKTEAPFFDTVYLAAQRVNPLALEDTISIYVLKGAKIDIRQRLKAEADKKKNFR